MSKSLILSSSALDKIFGGQPPQGSEGQAIVPDPGMSIAATEGLLADIIAPEQVPLPQIPSKSSQTFTGTVYHIILDCDFGKRKNLGENKSSFLGRTRNLPSVVAGGRIPVLFDEADLENISKRLIYLVSKDGSVGTGANKKYPVFGTIALAIKLNNVSVSDVSIQGEGGKDYSKVENSNDDLVTYMSSERSGLLDKQHKLSTRQFKRGTLSIKALSEATVTPVSYINDTRMDERVGFSLLNLNPNLSAEDVKELKALYDKTLKSGSLHKEAVILPSEEHSVGGSIDYEALYRQEKKRYLQLKEIAHKMGNISRDTTISIPTKPSIGGSVNYETLYQQEKKRYLQLKEIAHKMGLMTK